MPKIKWQNNGVKIKTPNGEFFKSKLWGNTTLQLQQITGIKCRSIPVWRDRLSYGDCRGIVKLARGVMYGNNKKLRLTFWEGQE